MEVILGKYLFQEIEYRFIGFLFSLNKSHMPDMLKHMYFTNIRQKGLCHDIFYRDPRILPPYDK